MASTGLKRGVRSAVAKSLAELLVATRSGVNYNGREVDDGVEFAHSSCGGITGGWRRSSG
jgi:hypothetical protein